MKKIIAVGLLIFMVSATGCATSFYGSSKVDGPKDCRKFCSEWDMELIGMVAMGQYTNGCICRVKGEQLSLKGIGGALLTSSAGAMAASSAVYIKNQED